VAARGQGEHAAIVFAVPCLHSRLPLIVALIPPLVAAQIVLRALNDTRTTFCSVEFDSGAQDGTPL
jgi:hypothetical protein